MNNAYQAVTSQIIAHLETGKIPWRKPWTNQYGGLPPTNYKSMKPYRGINYFLLSMFFDNPYFLTYRQAQDLGGQVKKGATGVKCIYWNYVYKDANGNKVKSMVKDGTKQGFIKNFVLFSADQIEGIEFDYPKTVELKQNAKLDQCEAVIKQNRPTLKTGTKAVYSIVMDEIRMPEIAAFESSEEYYSTLFHELAHWSGAPHRLSRFPYKQMSNNFRKSAYGKEELVAEMCSAYLCADCQISKPVIKNQAAYLQGWLETLKADNNVLIRAASQAQKAADYLWPMESDALIGRLQTAAA